MKVTGDGQPALASGNLFIKYYGAQNPDGSVPTKVVVLVGEKNQIQAFENIAEPAFRILIGDVFNFVRDFGAAPTLDENGMLDPPTQTYTPDPEFDELP
jgi:hypothetical protein